MMKLPRVPWRVTLAGVIWSDPLRGASAGRRLTDATSNVGAATAGCARIPPQANSSAAASLILLWLYYHRRRCVGERADESRSWQAKAPAPQRRTPAQTPAWQAGSPLHVLRRIARYAEAVVGVTEFRGNAAAGGATGNLYGMGPG